MFNLNLNKSAFIFCLLVATANSVFAQQILGNQKLTSRELNNPGSITEFLAESSEVADQTKNTNLKKLTAAVLDHPKAISDFALQGTNGKPFNNQSLKDHWTLLFFGFTH